jgi:hypothetical protein
VVTVIVKLNILIAKTVEYLCVRPTSKNDELCFSYSVDTLVMMT